MNEVVKIIGKFFTRDFLYILGGTSVIICFLYLFNIIPEKSFKNYELFFLLSVGYVIGYINQEFYSILRIITTATPNKVYKLCKWMFKRFTLREFNEEILKLNSQSEFYNVVSKLDDRKHAELQRIISLKQVGTTIGSNWLTCSVILFFNFMKSLNKEFDLTLFIGSLIMSLILITLGWIKTLQQVEFIVKYK